MMTAHLNPLWGHESGADLPLAWIPHDVLGYSGPFGGGQSCGTTKYEKFTWDFWVDGDGFLNQGETLHRALERGCRFREIRMTAAASGDALPNSGKPLQRAVYSMKRCSRIPSPVRQDPRFFRGIPFRINKNLKDSVVFLFILLIDSRRGKD